MIVIESTGRKLKDAIDNGLRELGKSLNEVDIDIIDNGGLFRKAKVRITVREDEELASELPAQKAEAIVQTEKPAEKTERPQKAAEPTAEKVQKPAERRPEKPINAEERPARPQPTNAPRSDKRPARPQQKPLKPKKEEQKTEERHYEPATPEIAQKAESYITSLIEKMGIEASVDTAIEDGELRISLSTENSTLIGYHGEVLEAIENLTSYSINREHDRYCRITVDCNSYRDRRKESLIAHANKMAQKCIKVRHKIVLEPMNSIDRKVIHSALADNEQVMTKSEGHEPNRRVVILYKR